MNGHPPAIVLGIDTPIGLSVVRELGRHGVPVHGVGRKVSAIGAASRYCHTSSVRPDGRPLREWLPDLISATGAKALLAISESDLIALAALDPVIHGCQILTPRLGPLNVVLDKTQTLARAQSMGIDIPVSWLPAPNDDFAARAAAFAYPIVAKWPDPPRVADRLEKAGLAFNKAEFIAGPVGLLALLDRYKPLGCWPLIQQYCPGDGVGQMIFMQNGAATLRFQHRRLHEWPPEGGASTYCQSEPHSAHAQQMALSEKLLRNIGWQGPAMVEYRHDRATGRYWLMEINGRFWGSLPLAAHAGACFAWEAYRRAVLGDMRPAAPYREGVRARYMIPETRRLIRVLLQRSKISDPYFKPRPVHDLASFIFGFLDPRMRYFVFSWRDPGPFVSDLTSAIRKALRLETP